MASNEIKLTQSLDDRQYIEALNRQLKLIDRLEQRMSALSKESKKASKELLDLESHGQKSLVDVSKITTGIAAGFAAIIGGLKEMISLEEQAQKKAADMGKEYDSLQRSFRVLSGLRGLEAGAAQKSIEDIAFKHSFTKEQAYGTATELVSAGFSPSQASGAALDEFLYGAAANGQVEGNPSQLVESVSGYLSSTGKKKDAAGIRDVMARIQALGSTQFTINDLPALSGEAGSLKELNSEEQFAGMAVLRESVKGTTAATVMRNVVSALTSQRTNKSAMKALKGLGVNPEDVDLLGEDFSTAVSRMKEAYDKASPEMRNSYLATFAGRESRSAFVAMMDNTEAFNKAIKDQGDLSGYEGAHDEAVTGPNAIRRRADLRIGQLRRDRDEKIDIHEQLIEIQALEAGANEFGVSTAKQIYRTGKAITGMMDGDKKEVRDIKDIAAELSGNTAALRENTAEMQRQGRREPPTRQVQRQ